MVRRLALAALAVGAMTCSLDPVKSEATSDLGDEAPGVSPGPLHRAGQPCLVCHDGTTSTPVMSVAGTVYGVRGSDAPLAGASVFLTDANGSAFTATSNAAGTFYVEASVWQPVYPLRVAVAFGGFTATMSSIIGREGSCAGCHVDPSSRISAGRIYLVPTASLFPDGGAR